MTSTSTATNYIPSQQTKTSYHNLSQHHLALQQAQHAEQSHQLDYDDFDPAQFSPEALDLALKDFAQYSPMQPDTSGAISQFTPKLGRSSHQRESSLSSLGSVGPASPFTQNISNPRIAINDSATEFGDMYNNDTNIHNTGAYYQLAKPMDAFSGYQHLDAATPDMAYPVALPGHMNRHRGDRSLLPAPEFNNMFNRSHPASVASSVAGDSPSTPSMGDVDHIDRTRRGMRRADRKTSDKCSQPWYAVAYGNVPKLDRTMTDVYGDELYNPSFAITSSSPATQAQNTSHAGNQIFSQRLSAANSQHLNASAHSPSSTASRGLSPFQATSPFAPPQLQDFGTTFGSGQSLSHDHQAQQQSALMGTQAMGDGEPETPKTISPRDAMIEFTGGDGEPNFSLFPEGSNGFDFDAYNKAIAAEADVSAGQFNSVQDAQRAFAQITADNRIPQQYPFVSRAQEIKDITPPPRLGSSGSSASEAKTDGSGTRPSRVGADSGTYTCTYHGCTLRFDTPVQLQKHKREGHRQTQNLGGGLRAQEASMASVLNSQAGPHRCDRINPSTGKPCSTIFSRPYDLTRHEDTIHNERKHKVQCDLCTVEKTFSRADALTRHYRVCHPDAELPGKHRRRVI